MWERRFDIIDNNSFLKNNDINIFKNSSFLFEEMLINNEYQSIRNQSNIFKNELRYLNHRECEILTKLRTEYINLGYFKYEFFPRDNPSSCCMECHCKDDLMHFFWDCNINSIDKHRIDHLRNKFIRKLKNIDSHFRFGNNRNMMDLLFPHTWLNKIFDKKLNFKYDMNIVMSKKIKIYKLISKFVLDSNRFKYDQYGI